MSEVIYDNVIRTETLDREETIEMMVDIYESSEYARNPEHMINTERHQELQHTGSVSVKNRRHRAVQVCLWLLCVLLLTAVIVLCVYFTTDRKHLLTHNYNLTKERETLLTEYTEILNLNRNLTEEREQIKNNADELSKKFNALQDQHSDNFKWIYYNFSFYHISSNSESWSNSRRDCRQRGADLVIINSKEEQEFLQKSASNRNFYWIGLSKVEGVWKWIDETFLAI
ncbi:CD209 antigen-like protein E [Triplophysa dalaica]|uniref:CD209 antigen-like protein E n=1 Tax=Triplophysa dalaica TaxID=1582913 RepID=UPI0024DF894C|nr:CD209 antigen-like protein E [Triplophysa dalaica]